MEITSQAQTALHFVVVCVEKFEPSVSETVAADFNVLFLVVFRRKRGSQETTRLTPGSP